MKWFKLLSTLALFLMGIGAEASHIIGGDIYYKYIGGQTGVANQYEITMIIYREGTGAALTSPLLSDWNITDIRIEGINCTYSQQLQMYLTQPEFPASQLGAFDCILPGPGIPDPRVNIYKDTIVINSSCNQFRIWLLGCCRPNNYTNIQNSGNFYFESELNRRLGDNSAPNFLNTPVNYACRNAYQVYQQNAVEPDGDSLFYELIPAKLTNNALVNYNSPFTFTNPISTDPQFPFTLDANTGTLTFQSNAANDEVSTFAIIVREYRFDTQYGFWEEIGYASREIQLVVRASCRPEVNAGVRLDPDAPGVYIDTATGHQVKDYSCGDTTVTLDFTLPIECFSVAEDGTDFRLTTPNGQPLPIKRAVPFCNNDFETESIRLDLYKPLIIGGDYFLYTKVGTDGNTLFNKCGKSMNEFDTILLRVPCIYPVFDLENVTVVDDQHTFTQWSVDTATLDESLVDFIRIYRSEDNGANFNLIGTAGIADSGYVDFSVNGQNVDARSYRYRAQFVVAGQELNSTRAIKSILLQGALINNDEVPMSWSAYDGWNGPTYTAEFGSPDGNGDYDWTNITDQAFPTSDPSYVFDASWLADGNYALRVKTNMENGYQSESNWIIFSKPFVPDPEIPAVTLTVPNVFTPGEDGLNDLWTINGLDSFDRVEVTIFDRWGKQVYTNGQYSNDKAWNGQTNNGRDLAEGTYFYVLTADGGPGGASLQESGSVNLMK